MHRKLIITLSITAASGVLLGYILLIGKLAPFSPIVIGFTRHELQRAIIYAEKGCEFTHFDDIDAYIPVVEQFHSLRFKPRPKIFLFGNASTYKRRVLSQARFCTYYHGDIMVSPWAQKEAVEGLISMEIYLRHELSHSLPMVGKNFSNTCPDSWSEVITTPCSRMFSALILTPVFYNLKMFCEWRMMGGFGFKKGPNGRSFNDE